MGWRTEPVVPAGEVRIAEVAVAHPRLRVSQDEAATHLGELVGDPRRARILGRRSGIDSRAVSAPLDCLTSLRSVEQRNRIYREVAPELAREAACAVLGSGEAVPGVLVSSSCTGLHLPGWGAGLVRDLHLPRHVWRLPITESGCAGGVVAMTAAAKALRAGGERSALVVAVELCSLSLHLDPEEGNLTSALLFGDGAGAARLETGPGSGLRIVGTGSALVPDSGELLGFELRDSGLFPILARELVAALPPAFEGALGRLLGDCGLTPGDVTGWLIHPGGSAILRGIERQMALPEGATRWSWDSLRENGNTSSAAIFDVVRRYMADGPAPGSKAVIAAFGPGVAIELMVVEAC